MSRLFLRLSAVVWLVTVLATVAVIGITYAVGIFPPRDLQMQAVQDFALTTATQGASMRSAKLLYEAVYEHETLTTQRGEDRIKRIWAELVAGVVKYGEDIA